MTDFTAGKLTAEVRGLLKGASKISGDNYPECLGNMYVTNAPFVFTACWKICKAFVDERTQKKISIKGSDYQKYLLEAIEKENLPTWLGGTCTCEGLGGCAYSDIGPWNDYEPVYPFGIKPK